MSFLNANGGRKTDIEKRPIIIDMDPGVDDTVALAITLNHPNPEVRLITTVAGNVDVRRTTNNASKLVDFFRKGVPIAEGCNCPLLTQLEDSAEIHGEINMSGFEFPQPISTCLNIHAAEAMREGILFSNVSLIIVPIVALVNTALLLTLYPEVKESIAEIVMMGGSSVRGNINTNAELNTHVNPYAAQTVLQPGVPLTMVGLDVTDQAVPMNHEVAVIRALGRVGEMFYSLFRHYRDGSLATGLKMYDTCAITCLISPRLFKIIEILIEIALEDPTAGTTTADLEMKYHKNTNVVACIDVSAEAFQEWAVEKMRAAN